MTIDDMLRRIRADVATKQAARNGTPEAILIDRVRSDCAAKNRAPTEAESGRVQAAKRALAGTDAEIDVLLARIDDLELEKNRDLAADRLAREVHPAAQRPSYDQVARINYESHTYRPDHASSGEPSFLLDLARSQVWRDPAASERLARHQAEMAIDRPGWQDRAIGTGAVTGLVPPQYLTDEYAELARAGRPAADACHSLPLPADGMTVNISRITTGSSAAVQTAENSAVSETNLDDTLLTVNVNTISGQQTVSRQAIERGGLVEQVLMGDLLGAYNAALDSQVISGSGGSGQHLGILSTSGVNAITYTDASPTTAELWPKEVDAVRQVAVNRFTGATHIVMTPAMWGWHLAALDTTGRPIFDVGGSNSPSMNMLGGASGNAYQNSGTLLGCKLVQSGGVPTNLGAGTNETRIIAADFRDIYLWETPDSPVFIRAEQPSAASLGVLFVIYAYSAFTAGRQPKAISVVSGTGLIPAAL